MDRKKLRDGSRERLRSALYRFPSIIIAATIWCLSSMHSVPLPKGDFMWDKIAHAIAFGSFSLTVGLWFHPMKFRLIEIAVAIGAVALYGAIDEFHQYFVPGRTTSLKDWLADVIGGCLACSIVFGIKKILSKRV